MPRISLHLIDTGQQPCSFLCCCLFLSPRYQFTIKCLDWPTLGLYSPLNQHPASRQEDTEKPCGQEKQHKRYEVVPRKSEAMDKPEVSPLGSCHHPSLYMSNRRKQIHEHEEDHRARRARDHEPYAGLTHIYVLVCLLPSLSIPRGQRKIVQPPASVCPEGRENTLATELCAALT